jgi:type II secretory pathway component PulM
MDMYGSVRPAPLLQERIEDTEKAIEKQRALVAKLSAEGHEVTDVSRELNVRLVRQRILLRAASIR